MKSPPPPLGLLRLAAAALLAVLALRAPDSDRGAPLRAAPPLLRRLSFRRLAAAGQDFGLRLRRPPAAILRPQSAADVAAAVRLVFAVGRGSTLTVAARGGGHSLHGQSLAPGGIVVSMASLQRPPAIVYAEGEIFVDASGGERWIDLLRETLKHGLAPRSWTDYLHLTVGGTLSNAGLSGQAFRHGPQISNVRELEVVTGRGEVVNCSDKENDDLFFAVLGGLGQFGIITRARIVLEPAPKMVRWIRVLYDDFTTFIRDQEMLISLEKTFDYIEGFVMINRSGILNSWRSSFNPQDPIGSAQLNTDRKILFCLEMAKNYDLWTLQEAQKEVDEVLSRLGYLPSTLFQTDVTYVDFLDRVHASEKKLRAQGLWEIPHPWLNLFVPASRIHDFAAGVFGRILTDSSSGPILLYPVNKSKWDNRSSAVIPDEQVFYLVGFLHAVLPSEGEGGLKKALENNDRVLEVCRREGIKAKQYLPHYTGKSEWMEHFGERWETLLRRKLAYDPMAILAPGQRIFQKGKVP
ncbi:cytokinin dehydrogenase 9-like [Wolffia australiana]